MLKWIPYAMVRITAFFTAGILLAIYFPELISLGWSLGISLSLVGLYFLLPIFTRGRSLHFVSGIVGLTAVLFLGYSKLLINTDSWKGNSLSNFQEPIKMYTATVRSFPQSKAKSWKVEVEITAVKSNEWHPIHSKLLLYVSKKTNELDWKYGDRLLLQGSPQPLKQPANPGEFDFKRFLSFKNIFHQHFILPEQVKLITHTEKKGFIYYSHEARRWASQKLNQSIHGEQEQAIGAALILGVTEGIDTDLQNAYAASGAMHVLSVSGLHVGIIYAILLFLLRPLNNYKWSRWVVALISLICLWVFAFVTGLSPSVLRAVTMFSFIAAARPFGARTNIYNTLAASAFVLLLYNPYLVMSVGFQLSYLAVLGIVYLQKPIYNLLEIESYLGDWVWKITCVSIAAQIATFSLGLLYFHQFPVYFLISNLFVIPLSTLVLVTGIVLLAVSFISPFAFLVGKLLEWMIWFLNWIVFLVEDLPFSLINEIHITTFQCWLLMGSLLAIAFLFEFRTIRWLHIAFAIALLFSAFQWFYFYETVDKNQFVAYSINGHYAYEWTDRGQSYFYSDSSLLKDDQRIRFHIKPNRLQTGTAIVNENIQFVKKEHGIEIVIWKGKSYSMILDKVYRLPNNFSTDFLLVGRNSFSAFDQKPLNLKIGQLIIDGSNSRSYSNRLIKFSKINNIPAYSVAESGAFILNN